MKNHVMPPAEFIAPSSFRAFGHETTMCKFPSHALSAHDKKCVLLIAIIGQKGYGN